MLQSLFSGISALTGHVQYLGVIANNLANVNTIGFKGSRTLFQDSVSLTLSPSSSSTDTSGGKNGVQIGLGVTVGSVTPTFSQGSLQGTGITTDVAIEGDGFFVLRDLQTDQLFYGRAGNFRLDNDNFLVDANGLRVQGVLSLDQSDPSAPFEGELLEDLLVESQLDDPIESFVIDDEGRIAFKTQGGEVGTVGFIALNRFANPQGLDKVGKNLYSSTPAANKILDDAGEDVYASPGTNGLGRFRAGFLEQSNVDLGREFTEMIRSQRGLQANSRIVTTSDEVLNELVNLKR